METQMGCVTGVMNRDNALSATDLALLAYDIYDLARIKEL